MERHEDTAIRTKGEIYTIEDYKKRVDSMNYISIEEERQRVVKTLEVAREQQDKELMECLGNSLRVLNDAIAKKTENDIKAAEAEIKLIEARTSEYEAKTKREEVRTNNVVKLLTEGAKLALIAVIGHLAYQTDESDDAPKNRETKRFFDKFRF